MEQKFEVGVVGYGKQSINLITELVNDKQKTKLGNAFFAYNGETCNVFVLDNGVGVMGLKDVHTGKVYYLKKCNLLSKAFNGYLKTDELVGFDGKSSDVVTSSKAIYAIGERVGCLEISEKSHKIFEVLRDSFGKELNNKFNNRNDIIMKLSTDINVSNDELLAIGELYAKAIQSDLHPSCGEESIEM